MATLYAQPTKEWVIPAKPKPGRKPKRDEPVADEDGGSDCKAKKVQNRAAQRAFRERKQSQLADLQARLTQYEQGEIERNVALQSVAKKLKEENERLKLDNEKLREEGDRVRVENMLMRTRLRELQEEFLAYRRSVDPSSHAELETFINTRKRTRAGSTAPLHVLAQSPVTVVPATKRKRGREDTRSSTPPLNIGTSSFSETRRTASKGYSTLPPDYVAPAPQAAFAYSPSSTSMSSGPSLAMSPEASEHSSGAEPASFDGLSSHPDTTMHDFSDKLGSDFDSASDNLHMVDCGFCSKDSGDCVCREVSISLNQLIESGSSSAPNTTSLLGDLNMASTSTVLLSTANPTSSGATKSSILDNLPPVQPGVPLRLRRSKQSSAGTSAIEGGPVHLTPVPQLVQLQPVVEPSSRPVCSGDPSNCAACVGDPFGRAFCMALASGGICRDDKCMRCPKSNRNSQPKTSSLPEDKGGKGKGKAIPMEVDVGSNSGVGLGMGMGMSMEAGMLLCCGDPKLCGGGGCNVRAPSSPMKIAGLQRPTLQTAGSSGNFNHPHSHARLIVDTDMEEGGKEVVRLPPFSSREDQEASEIPADSDAADQDIPTNDAWARLKAHPNIAFADLALLADVVARRTKCTGPRVLLSPSPERGTEPRVGEGGGDHHEAANENEEHDVMHPPPTLVPHDALVRCGRERLMRVQAEGVRDALAMLDVQRSA